jgi:hypothetical protein
VSYNDYEASRVGANPVELFLFRYGEAAEAFRAYTNALAPITFNDVEYQPIPIDRDSQKISGALDSSSAEIEVRLPKSTDIGRLFAYFPPSFMVRLTVFKGNVADPATPSSWQTGENFPVAFIGKVNEGSLDGEMRKLSCSPLGNSLKRPGLRRNYQLSCPHVLYGPRCLADKGAAMTTGAVAGIAGTTLSLDPGWMKPGVTPSDYIGGVVEWNGDSGTEYRAILAASENTVTLMGPTRYLTAGNTVSIYLGCPHSFSACSELHDNVQNYGGQPFIPIENPIGKNIYD